MSAGRHVLLVSYEFPPKGGPGIQWPVKTAKYLAALGWEVTVLTVKDPLGGMMDATPLGELPASVCIERAWSLEPTRFVAAARAARGGDRRGRRGGGPASGAREADATGAPGTRGYTSLPRGVIRFVQAFFVPDEKVGWAPWAVRAALRVHARRPIDVVLATGPPFSTYRVGWRVARRLGVPWVADLRDPIVEGYFFRPATPLHERLLRRYERTVAGRAARVVTATEGFSAGVRRRNPGRAAAVETIPNGFDPADFAGPAPEPRAGLVLAYVGTFQGSIRPDTLLAALARLRAAGAPAAADIRVRLVGALDPETARAIEEHGVADLVERTGFLSHAEAVREMRAAHALLLVLGPEPESAAIMPGKLPEYLAAGRPVLGLVPEGVSADLIRRAGAGEVVRPTDVEATAAALVRLHDRWREGDLPHPDPAVVAGFDRSALAARYAEVLGTVIREARS